ncbi:MAG TPA: RnfABCDGE type electron transport complex subunit B [bacterium]|nr:RnfABCDGE type electron transport complex subunit B [bacterium]
MLNVLYACAGMGLLGVLFGVVLAVVSKKFAVETDPKVAAVTDALPGANCGACGAPGCAGYAAAVAGGTMAPDRCIPGGNAVAKTIAGIMGVAVAETEPVRAQVICQGFDPCATDKAAWTGVRTCAAAAAVGGGPRSCRFGCIGFGDCRRACPFNAIAMHGRTPVVTDRCTGCGMCMAACPKGVIVLRPKDRPVHIRCRTGEPAKVSRTQCQKSCIKCKICVKACPQQAIVWMSDPHDALLLWADGKYPSLALERLHDLPVINYAKCTNCGICAQKCPRKVIVDLRAAAASAPALPVAR